MRFIGDFHIHSHFSVATSRDLVPEQLDWWARIKGIKVIGTGDFTHPGWIKELEQKLEPSEPGLFRLKNKYRMETDLPAMADREPRFILTAEISSIYKKSGRVRKVHNLILAPDFQAVKKIQRKLSRMGANITSDGRPILGLDSKDLLELCLHACEEIFFVPAHIWTPWFSALGDKSGFDSIEECFEDLTDHVHAVETGLSTDPPMHWLCSFLDRFTLISNSDAHSPDKLGRNANLFDTDLSYEAITVAIKTGDPKRFLGTIDLFPQEGKYHYDGHRKCGIVWDPVETLKHKNLCPRCGKKVTIGVMNRIAQLADRDDPLLRKNQLPFYCVIPLREILSELLGCGKNTKKVDQVYQALARKAGGEMDLLLFLPIEEIEKKSDRKLAEAIRRMRERQVYVKEGYDGEFGRVKLFREGEMNLLDPEPMLFEIPVSLAPAEKRKLISFDLKEYRKKKGARANSLSIREDSEIYEAEGKQFQGLNLAQQKAAQHERGPALIIAGPGSGKTQTLTYRAAHLIKNKGIACENILAVTFTNKAAAEMKQRLKALLNNPDISAHLQVFTFHGLGYMILKKYAEKAGRRRYFSIADEEDKKGILAKHLKCDAKKIHQISNALREAKQNFKSPEELEDGDMGEIYSRYEKILQELNMFDLDDLICHPVKIFEKHPEILKEYREKYPWILVDEYQDVNFAQYRMIRMLMPEADSNLCVIGDPNQAIYGFRGADVRFIRQFREDYPDAAVYRLNTSYRCSDNILRASGSVIQEGGGAGDFLTGLTRGVKIRIVENDTDKSEAEFVARTIEQMIGGTRFFSMDSAITQGNEEEDIRSLSDFAILCRIGKEMKALEKALTDHGIPYQTVGDDPFFMQEPVRSVIEILKLLVNPQNEFLKKKFKAKKERFKINPKKWTQVLREKSVKDAVTAIMDAFFNGAKNEEEPAITRLLDLAEEFGGDYEEFLRLTALGISADAYRPDMENVTLMTLHASKGLEFKCVFIVGCEEGLLPYSLFKNLAAEMEEERRLLYVGMTRAMNHLFLTHVKKRMLMGREYRLPRSSFLDRIEKELLEYTRPEYKKSAVRDDPQLTLF